MGHVDTKAFKFDIEQAKKYIAASKYANDYANYPIEIVVNSDVSDLEKIALMMQSAAKEIGVTITIAKAPWVSLIDQMGSSTLLRRSMMQVSIYRAVMEMRQKEPGRMVSG